MVGRVGPVALGRLAGRILLGYGPGLLLDVGRHRRVQATVVRVIVVLEI